MSLRTSGETTVDDHDLLLTTVGNNNKVWLGKFVSKFTLEANDEPFDIDDLDFNDDGGASFCPEGWYEYCGGYQGCGYEYESRINRTQPTHSMPIPTSIMGEQE